MAEQDKQSAEKKVLKVVCNPSSDEKIPVVASNYHEFIVKCKFANFYCLYIYILF